MWKQLAKTYFVFENNLGIIVHLAVWNNRGPQHNQWFGMVAEKEFFLDGNLPVTEAQKIMTAELGQALREQLFKVQAM